MGPRGVLQSRTNCHSVRLREHALQRVFTEARVMDSERLARQLFQRSERGEQEENVPALHPEAELVPSHDPSSVVSRDDFVAHLASGDAPRAVDAVGHVYRPLDDERIIVEGRVRIRQPQGGFADRPMVWALIFRDGLLYRSWAVDDVTYAERLLAQPQHSND